MLESGKRFIVRNMIRATDQYFRLQDRTPTLKLLTWSNDTTLVAWEPGQDVPDTAIGSSGSLSGTSLINALSSLSDSYYLMFTDGYWDSETQKQIKAWSQSVPPGRLRIVKIGEDANPRLKGPNVFSCEDFLCAVEGWVE